MEEKENAVVEEEGTAMAEVSRRTTLMSPMMTTTMVYLQGKHIMPNLKKP